MAWRLVISFLLFSSVYAQDLEVPTTPADYRSAQLIMNANGLALEDWEAWFKPGDDFCRVRYAQNCDGSKPTGLQISTAQTTWGNMAQCDRARIRLYNEATTKKEHQVNGERQVWMYSTAIPASKITALQGCLSATFRYLGKEFSVACSNANTIQAGLCANFWPGEVMSEIIFGWEADAL